MDVKGQCFKYLPYSAGRRMCPGVTVSLQMMHLVLGRMLQGFDLATPMHARVDIAEGLGLALPKATLLEVMLIPRLPRMAEGLGLALPKATPLEVMLIPHLPRKLYQ
ncbi:Xanthotoxin 5-hydroxylase CYP82C2 [Camellia lanceoleosa]|nr:Xanthotoxin 5-hydroxylase CYP82C2 [Camellia lanceoleosa]